MSLSLAVERLTVNCPSSPGSAAAASFAAMVTLAKSSSVIVRVAVVAACEASSVTSASSAPVKVNVRVSLSSRIASSMTLTSMTADVSPAKINTLPDNAV